MRRQRRRRLPGGPLAALSRDEQDPQDRSMTGSIHIAIIYLHIILAQATGGMLALAVFTELHVLETGQLPPSRPPPPTRVAERRSDPPCPAGRGWRRPASRAAASASRAASGGSARRRCGSTAPSLAWAASRCGFLQDTAMSMMSNPCG